MEKLLITYIKDPFDPIKSQRIIEAEKGLTVKEYMGLIEPCHEECEYVISTNGAILPADADIELVRPESSLVFCAVPQGGGGKDILRIVAMLAIVVAAYQFAPMIAAAWGVPAWAPFLDIIVIGNILLNVLWPVPSGPSVPQIEQTSPTYGWNAANANSENTVWPVLYGTCRITPPIISKYIEVVDDKQYLHLLFGVADHEIDEIDFSSVRINRNEVQEGDEIEFDWRPGTLDQSCIPWFHDTRTAKLIGQKLSVHPDWSETTEYFQDDCVTYRPERKAYKCKTTCTNKIPPNEPTYWELTENPWTTVQAEGSAIEGLTVAISLPKGLFYVADNGDLSEYTVKLDIELRRVGDIEWEKLTGRNEAEDFVADRWSGGYYANWKKQESSWVEMEAGSLVFEDHIEGDVYTPDYWTFWSPIEQGGESDPPRKEYIWHWVTSQPSKGAAGSIALDYVEITSNKTTPVRRTYPRDNFPTDKIGAYDVRVRFHGNEVPHKHNRYGNEVYIDYLESIIYDNLSMPGSALFAVRALATDRFSGSSVPKVDFIAKRLTVPVWTGTQYEDKSADNIAWACYDSIHDSIYGGASPVERIDYDAFEEWADFCTSKGFKCNLYVDELSTLRKAMDGLGLLGRGNVIQIGSMFTCFIDKPVSSISQVFNATNFKQGTLLKEGMDIENRANSLEVTFWNEDNYFERETFPINAPDFDTTTEETKKTSIVLKGCSTRAHALKIGRYLMNCTQRLLNTYKWEADVDAIGCLPWQVVEIQHTILKSGYGGRVVSATSNTVTLDQNVLLTAYETYYIKVRDSLTDALYEYTVQGVLEDTLTDVLTITGTFSPVPAFPDMWNLGHAGQMAKKVRFLKTTRKNDQTRTLYGIEYDEDVYDDSGTIDPPPQPAAITYVEFLTVNEHQSWRGDNRTYLQLAWRGFAFLWHVWYKPASQTQWLYAGQTTTPSFIFSELDYGVIYDFCVSHTRNPLDGKTIDATLTGEIFLPEPPVNFTATLTGQFITLEWTFSPDSTIQGYSIYLNDNLLVERFMGNKYIYRGNLAVDDYEFALKALTKSGESETAATAGISIVAPSTPTVVCNISGELSVVTWNDCKQTLPIDYYVVNGEKQSNSPRFTERITWTGGKEYAVYAVDIAGNQGSAGYQTLTISATVDAVGLWATSLPFQIRLTLGFVANADLEAMEIWYSDTNNRADAKKIAETLSLTWTHAGLNMADAFYYWIRARNKYGNYGAWYPAGATAGVPGTPSQVPGEYLQLLQDSLSESQLTSTLNQRINWIDTEEFVFEQDVIEEQVFNGLNGAYSGLIQIQAAQILQIGDLQELTSAQAALIASIQTEIAGLITTEYDPYANYNFGKYVVYEGEVYRCIQAHDYPPSYFPDVSPEYWENADALVELVGAIEERVDTLEYEITTKVSTVAFDGLENRVDLAESAIIQNSSDIALRVTTASFDAFAALVIPVFDEDSYYEVNEYVRYGDATYICIQEIDFTPAPLPTNPSYWDPLDLTLKMATALTDITAGKDGSWASISSKATTASVTALESRMTTAESDIDAGEAGSWASISSKLAVATYNTDQKDGNDYLRVAAIENRFGVYDTNNAPTWNNYTTYYPGTIVVLTAVYYRCVKQSLDNSPPNATYWTPISAGLLSQWTLKLNVNNHVAGVGMMLDQSGYSEFEILATKFAVINPSAEGQANKYPFVVGLVDGQSQVGIAGDLIVDGTIITRHLAAGSITAGKISVTNLSTISANMGSITSGSLSVGTGNAIFKVDTSGNIWSGHADYASAPFKVLAASGVLTATGVVISGQLVTGAGSSIGGGYLTNASVTGEKIGSGTITGANIGSATITGTNIGSATITGGNIANTTISAANIVNATITGAKIASATISGANIAAATISGANIAAATITGGNIASGTIAAANIANATITAAQISGTAGITGSQMANATITSAQISSSAAITGSQIASGTITSSNIAAGTIIAANIAALTITAAEIGNLTIVAGKIANGTLTTSQIASNANIAGSQLANQTITATQLATGTITATQIAAATIIGSNIATGTITSTNIQNGTITGTDIASATIAGSNIAAATIAGSNIAAATIAGSNIASATIAGSNIAGLTITSANIANTTITATQIANLTITAAQIANLTITGGKIANATIDNAKISDLSATKITAGTITSQAITLAVSEGAGDVKIQAGKTDFTDYAASGFILGIDDSDSNKGKFLVGSSAKKYLEFDGSDIKMGTETQMLGCDAYANSNIYYHHFFDSIDGWFTSASGGGYAGMQAGSLMLSCTGTPAVAQASRTMSLGAMVPTTFDKARRFKVRLQIITSGSSSFTGLHWAVGTGYVIANYPSNYNGFYFFFDNDQYLYGIVARSSYSQYVTLESGIVGSYSDGYYRWTATLEAVWRYPTTQVDFYINGVFKGSCTGFVTPQGTSMAECWCSFVMNNIQAGRSYSLLTNEIVVIQEG